MLQKPNDKIEKTANLTGTCEAKASYIRKWTDEKDTVAFLHCINMLK